MAIGDPGFAENKRRAVVAALCSVFLASCTATSDPALPVGFAPGAGDTLGSAEAPILTADGIPLPSPRPADGESARQVALADAPEQKSRDNTAGVTEPETATRENAETADSQPRPAGDEAATEGSTATTRDSDEATSADAASETAEVGETEPAEADAGEASKQGFLSAFFSPASAAETPAARAVSPREEPGPSDAETPAAEPAPAPEPETVSASITGGEALPGVRETRSLFEITRKSGTDDDSDIDLYESPGSYRVASAAGMARLAPNGLLKQRDSVDVSCFKPGLMRVLKSVERRYGKRVLVTSGYRSPSHNRRVRGARNSLHMKCAAADIQVAGVGKRELARYVRAMPGRGGVGTYCHTNSIHVDVGPERDWNWRCKRRR